MISSVRFTLSGIGGVLVLSGLVVLTTIDQDVARHNFGHSGGMYFLRSPTLLSLLMHVCRFLSQFPNQCYFSKLVVTYDQIYILQNESMFFLQDSFVHLFRFCQSPPSSSTCTC